MKNISDINIKDLHIQERVIKVIEFLKRTTKTQRILFAISIILLIAAFLYGKNLWQEYSILRQAKSLAAKITQSQKDFLAKDKKYKEDIFADNKLRSALNLSRSSADSGTDSFRRNQKGNKSSSTRTSSKRNSSNRSSSSRSSSSRSGYSRDDYDNDDDNYSQNSFGSKSRSRSGSSSKRKVGKSAQRIEDYDIAQTGDFYIENDAENGCVVLKYKRNTPEKTIFYASFTDGKVFCQGKRCIKETKNNEVDLCYVDGICFPTKQLQETERSCGDGNGIQKRKCKATCENGSCKEWGACKCKKGFEWTGKTCKQSQTENDCTEDQCFNGIYCENKDKLEKSIENGKCTRVAACQKNTGWQYTSWTCSCNSENYCSLGEQCIFRPQSKNEITLSEEDGGSSCSNIYYECKNGEGWEEHAQSCVCNKIGFFWDPEKKDAKCSPCTNKPEGAIYTSAGNNKNDCSWKCDDEHESRKGTCTKPNGQYLCAKTDLQICTDEFSKNRKMKIDAKKTNEGQKCYVEDKDNVLFYNQKDKTCQICQCVDLTTGKTSK